MRLRCESDWKLGKRGRGDGGISYVGGFWGELGRGGRILGIGDVNSVVFSPFIRSWGFVGGFGACLGGFGGGRSCLMDRFRRDWGSLYGMISCRGRILLSESGMDVEEACLALG